MSQLLFAGKAHLREALLMHEEALRLNRMFPDLGKKGSFKNVLKHYRERSMTMYDTLEEEDDFQVFYKV